MQKYKELVIEKLGWEKMDFEDKFVRAMKNTNKMYELMQEKPKQYSRDNSPSTDTQGVPKAKKNRSYEIETEEAMVKFSEMLLASTPKYMKFLKKCQPPASLTHTSCPIPLEKRMEAEDERAALEVKMVKCLSKIIEGNLDSIDDFIGMKNCTHFREEVKKLENKIQRLKGLDIKTLSKTSQSSLMKDSKSNSKDSIDSKRSKASVDSIAKLNFSKLKNKVSSYLQIQGANSSRGGSRYYDQEGNVCPYKADPTELDQYAKEKICDQLSFPVEKVTDRRLKNFQFKGRRGSKEEQEINSMNFRRKRRLSKSLISENATSFQNPMHPNQNSRLIRDPKSKHVLLRKNTQAKAKPMDF
jgi:hypothetical protein